ncbi:MFS transporter [Naasia lichenicola]|uniref:MFS transporter n=1 Tax=Naasia lichenicola TaxID=2565933 RepID=A0A4S4FMG9_9MICO|nr:MFS transporter [Naasia lichenicola]THG31633.1 MFS transporter [Naasia lichenicola]
MTSSPTALASHLSPVRLRLLVVSLLTVSFLGALDHTIVSTSLSTIAGELGALDQLSWVIVSYTLSATVLLPLLGKLADGLGPRSVFLTSLVLFLVASLACGFAQDMVQLVIARAFQGLGSAGLQLMSQTIIATVTTPRERPKLLSIIGAAFPVAILVGPLLGGLIADNLGWHWVFWINIPLGVVALALAVAAIPHIDGAGRKPFDFGGAVSFTFAMVALVLAVTWVAQPETRLGATVLFVVAAVAFGVFFVIERRVTDPFVPLGLLRNRTVAACVTLGAIIGIGLFSIVSYIPTYVQMAYRTTATVSGLVPIATVFGMLISSLFSGFVVSRTGLYRPFTIAGTALAAAGLLAMSLLPPGLPLCVPMIAMGAVGLGTGAFMSLIVAVVQSAVSRDSIGAITATTNLTRQVGATVGTAVIGGVIGSGVVARLPAALDPNTLTPQVARQSSEATQVQIATVYAEVLSPVFLVLAIIYGIGIVAAILLPAGRLPEHEVSAEAEVDPAINATLDAARDSALESQPTATPDPRSAPRSLTSKERP